MRHHGIGCWRIVHVRVVVLLYLVVGLRHDVPQIRVLHVHIGIGRGHDRLIRDVVAKLSGKLKLFEIGRWVVMLLLLVLIGRVVLRHLARLLLSHRLMLCDMPR